MQTHSIPAGPVRDWSGGGSERWKGVRLEGWVRVFLRGGEVCVCEVGRGGDGLHFVTAHQEHTKGTHTCPLWHWPLHASAATLCVTQHHTHSPSLCCVQTISTTCSAAVWFEGCAVNRWCGVGVGFNACMCCMHAFIKTNRVDNCQLVDVACQVDGMLIHCNNISGCIHVLGSDACGCIPNGCILKEGSPLRVLAMLVCAGALSIPRCSQGLPAGVLTDVVQLTLCRDSFEGCWSQHLQFDTSAPASIANIMHAEHQLQAITSSTAHRVTRVASLCSQTIAEPALQVAFEMTTRPQSPPARLRGKAARQRASTVGVSHNSKIPTLKTATDCSSIISSVFSQIHCYQCTGI